MLTLSFGFKKPETNDKGDIVFPALEDNIQQLNDHTHNGTNSAKISSASIDPLSETLSSANWVLVANDIYRQLVNLPASLAYDTTGFDCRLANGDIFYPTIERAAASQYYIYTNDPAQDVTVIYL